MQQQVKSFLASGNMIIDTSVFKLNGSSDLSIKTIGNQNNMVIVVDNFLENPFGFVEFLKTIPMQRSEEWFPGNQLKLNYYFPEFCPFMDGIAKVYDVAGGEKRFYYNQYDGNLEVLRRSNHPHIDPEISLAFNLYLNVHDEIDGESGTAFYRHKKSGLEYRPDFKAKYRYKYFDISTDEDPMEKVYYSPIRDDDHFEMYHLEEQQFNRLVIYEGHLFHNLFVEEGRYKNNTRNSFAMFL